MSRTWLRDGFDMCWIDDNNSCICSSCSLFCVVRVMVRVLQAPLFDGSKNANIVVNGAGLRPALYCLDCGKKTSLCGGMMRAYLACLRILLAYVWHLVSLVFLNGTHMYPLI